MRRCTSSRFEMALPSGIIPRGRCGEAKMGSFAFEKHYRVRELAGLWGLSAKTVTRMFAEEPGVIRVANEWTGKRKYATLSIPESVALRVHERLGNQTLQATLAGGQPRRIIRLRDLHAGVAKKPRSIFKRNPLQEHTHGECFTRYGAGGALGSFHLTQSRVYSEMSREWGSGNTPFFYFRERGSTRSRASQ